VPEALGVVEDGVYTSPNGTVFNGGSTPEVARLLIEVQPAMARLKEVIAYAPEPMVKHKPEDPLCNFIVDRLFADMSAIAARTGRKVDLAFTNRGGIRQDIAQGDVLLDDIVSMLPFANYLSYVQLEGRDLRNIFEFMAENGIQAVSGARIVIKDKKLVSVEIGGKPLDDDRLYGVATIDFLLDGGDGYKFARNAKDYLLTDIRIGDAVLADIRKMTAEGKELKYFTDGRIVREK
jgi:2',3'-cyclic-nucleotide 2'-phosphodiesterase (5'-nucleotidase family)